MGIFDLEKRTQFFALEIRKFIQKLPRTICVIEDAKQLARSSGSVAANYIEANESHSKKDYFFRIKICHKEAKESVLWLNLLEVGESDFLREKKAFLAKEAHELVLIFASILRKSGVIK
jgi:four helix bundle protein